MKKIILRWMGISIGLAMIPVFILGASQGGIVLSPFILVAGMIVGILGASLHVSIYALRKGSRSQKYKAAGFVLAGVSFVTWVVISSSGCGLDAEYAKQRVANHIESKPELNAIHLGAGHYDLEKCTYSAPYTDPDNSFTFIVSEFGKLHFARH